MRRNRIISAIGAIAVVLTLGAGAAGATTAVHADLTDNIVATVQGTGTTTPTNGILYIYDNVTAEHHTRSVTYYDVDGYNKTETLVNKAMPLGSVLKSETLDNDCASSANEGAVNPVGGDGVNCLPVLHQTEPKLYAIHGDLIGRFCRFAPPGFHLPCPIVIHRAETATGSGDYLTVGAKDHGGMTKVDYYCNVAGVDYHVIVTLPAIAAVDYNGNKVTTQAVVVRIILLPVTGVQAPSAVLVLQ